MEYSAQPVAFKVDRYGKASISMDDWMQMKKYAVELTVGKGKNVTEYTILHTTTGFISLADRRTAEWIADEFEIIRVVKDKKSKHFLEIKYRDVLHRLPFDGLLPDKIRTTFFNIGVAVNGSDGAHEAFSMYIQKAVEQLSAEEADNVLGWSTQNDLLHWNGSDSTPPMLKKKLATEPSVYLTELSKLIENCYPLQFVICSAAASTLLTYLQMKKQPVSPFGLSLVGKSSTGKTTALQLAASLYSSPDDENVFNAFYGTANALSKMLGRHHGVPIAYDESTIRNEISISNFVYTFTQGKEKLRLDSTSELKERSTWSCTALFSSENYLVNEEKDNLGILARIITIDDFIYTLDGAHSERIKQFASENYGYIGSLLSDYLMKAESTDILSQFTETRNEISQSLANECSLTERLTINYALIVMTSAILNSVGVIIDTDVMKKICIHLHNKISESANPGRNIVIQIFNYISCNFGKHSGIKWVLNSQKKILAVDILEADFEAILAKTVKTEKKTAVRHLLDEGFIVRSEKKRIKKKISIDGAVSYGYSFDMKKVEEAFGPITDEVYSNIKKFKDYDPQYERLIEVENDEEAIIHAGNYKIRCNEETAIGRAFLL